MTGFVAPTQVHMHILIHEPNHSGHRLTTVRVLIDALIELDPNRQIISRLTLATSQASLDSEEYAMQLSPISNRFKTQLVAETDLSKHPFVIAGRQLLGLRKLLRSQSIDHLYLPYADTLLQLLTLSRLIPGNRWWPPKPVTEALIMKSSFAYPYARASRRWLALQAVRYSGCDKVHLNDALALAYLRKNNSASIDRIKLIPDPITDTPTYDKQAARETLGLPIHARIVGCVGLINSRKGADVLVNAFMLANLRKTDILLLAGRLSPELQKLVAQANDPRIICKDYYLTESEMALVISATDLVATPYSKVVGSASIIIRAAIAQRLVLASDTGWSGHMVSHYGLGDTETVNDLHKFGSQLQNSLDRAPSYKPEKAAQQFADFNQLSNIHAHWTSLLRKQLGLSPHPDYFSWPDA